MEENIYDNQKARELLEALGIPSYLRGYQMTLLALEYIADDPRLNPGNTEAGLSTYGRAAAMRRRSRGRGHPPHNRESLENEPGSAGNALRRSTGAQAPAKGFSLGTVQCLL